MVKKFFELTSDLVLSLVLLGIITTAAVSVITLSPLTAEDYGYDSPQDQEQVLGENTIEDENTENRNVILYQGRLQVEDILEQHQFFSSESSNERGFSQNIEFGPVAEGKITKEVFKINNRSSEDTSFLVTLNIPNEYKSLANYGLVFNDREYIMISEEGQNVNFVDGTIGANKSIEFELLVDVKENINFPIDLTIEVDEISSR